MRKLITITLTFLVLWLMSVGLFAEVNVKVKGTVTTAKKKPKQEEIQTAIHNGKIAAIRKYATSVDSRKLQLISDLMPKIESNLDTYILDVRYLNEGVVENGTWEQLLEVTVDDTQLELLINQQMQSKMSSSEPLYLSFIYVAREVESVEVHDKTVQSFATNESDFKANDSLQGSGITTINTTGKVDTVTEKKLDATEITRTNLDANLDVNNQSSASSSSVAAKSNYRDENVSVKIKGNATVSDYNSNTNVSGNAVQTTTTDGTLTLTTETNTTGNKVITTDKDTYIMIDKSKSSVDKSFSSGSVVNKSEGVLYRAYNPGEIDTKVTEIFNKANFEVVPAYEVDISPEKFAYDFASLNEINSSTQKEATDLARNSGLDFLAVAMLDVGRESIDPVTGNYKIYVKTNGYIMDLRKKFAVKICSVGPVQYSGLGENPTVAKTNALIEAATNSSRDLVDQLRVKIGM